jgi:hypothetical protein
MLGLQPPPLPRRVTTPRFPALKVTLLVSLLFAAGLSLLPEVSVSAPAAASRGIASDLGAPVSSLINERQQDWQRSSTTYTPLPRRSAELNVLLSRAVDALTQGSAVASRDRLMALQASLHHSLYEVRNLRTLTALTPADPCAAQPGGVLGAVSAIKCHFEPTRAQSAAQLRDAEGTVAQRLAQISAERTRFAADLKQIGLTISPAQVDGLLKLATAHDLINLHAAYNNLKEITAQLRSAMLAASHSPQTAQRYYGIYVVLLEVAMHMHEEFFLKLHETYLPRLDALSAATNQTYEKATLLVKTTGRADLRQQLRGNVEALEMTRRAAALYRASLLSQAQAVNQSWQRLYEQHEVAVNSYRTVNLSSALLLQMQNTGKGFDNLKQLEVPALENLGNESLEKEFDRLSRALTNPNG